MLAFACRPRGIKLGENEHIEEPEWRPCVTGQPGSPTTSHLAPPPYTHAAGAVTCDAHHMTDPHPEGLGVSTCIDLALKNAGIERDEVRVLLVCVRLCGACLQPAWLCVSRGGEPGARQSACSPAHCPLLPAFVRRTNL